MQVAVVALHTMEQLALVVMAAVELVVNLA
jgi:hypothetical protein